MTEIKFRAWGHQGNDKYRMFYGVALSSWTIPYWQDMAICDHKLMQYINRKDENGKEIYEGDVVKEGGRLSEVRFSKSYSRFELITPTGRAGLYGFYGEIIGNIYENSELINETT